MKKVCTALLVMGLAVSAQAMGRVRAQEAQDRSEREGPKAVCCARAPEAKEAAGCGGAEKHACGERAKAACGAEAKGACGTQVKGACGTTGAGGGCATEQKAPAAKPAGCCGGH